MDYEKAYNEALERAKSFQEKYGGDYAGYIFPELRESEDEKIRKALINHFKSHRSLVGENWNGIECDDIIAYLEKQKDNQYFAGYVKGYCEGQKNPHLGEHKEQKPVEWTELTWKDIVELEGIINNVHYDFSAGIGQESFGKEVLERFRSKKDDAEVDACEQKMAEYEKNERIRKTLINIVKGACSKYGIKYKGDEITEEKLLSYLENLKEEEGYEAIPVESTFEYKLGFKAGKESEKKKESLRDFIDNFPYSDEQKEQKEESSKFELKTPEWVSKGWDDEYMINTVIGRYSLHAEVAKKRGDTHDYNLSKSMENWLRNVVKPLILEKQKEPNYTKRNALFDKCVENCDPKTIEEVNKRVDDIMNMSELSAFEQALTNFIGYWEDDEERWPSKFVKKYGKHILDMAREELQKEQKPVQSEEEKEYVRDIKSIIDYFRSCNKELNREYYQRIYDWLDGRHIEQKPSCWDSPVMTHEMVMDKQKPAEKPDYSGLTDFERAIHRGFLCAGVENVPVEIIKETAKDCLAHISPVEIHIDNPNIQKFDPSIEITTSDSSADGKELLYVSNKSYKIGFRDGVNSVKREWGAEDEKILDSLIRLYSREYSAYAWPWANGAFTYGDVVNFLKSLRPSWKPSEEQMKALQNAVALTAGNKVLAGLYEHLKKL